MRGFILFIVVCAFLSPVLYFAFRSQKSEDTNTTPPPVTAASPTGEAPKPEATPGQPPAGDLGDVNAPITSGPGGAPPPGMEPATLPPPPPPPPEGGTAQAPPVPGSVPGAAVESAPGAPKSPDEAGEAKLPPPEGEDLGEAESVNAPTEAAPPGRKAAGLEGAAHLNETQNAAEPEHMEEAPIEPAKPAKAVTKKTTQSAKATKSKKSAKSEKSTKSKKSSKATKTSKTSKSKSTKSAKATKSSKSKTAKNSKSGKKVAATSKGKRKPASAFKAGLHVFHKTCQVRSSPKTSAKAFGSVSKGKRLWVGDFNSDWGKLHYKKHTAYVPKGCL